MMLSSSKWASDKTLYYKFRKLILLGFVVRVEETVLQGNPENSIASIHAAG
jgi:hypothetical protein